jgi:IgA Peptidase M64/Peptidase M64 N-terminus
MTKRLVIFFLFLGAAVWPALSQVTFDDYFIDKAMRIDFYHVGDAKEEILTIDHICQEGIWPESRTHLIDPFGYGRYAVKVIDIASNRLIYSRGFDSMFGEYKTTTPALNGVKRVFERSVRIPYPKRPVLLVFEMQDKKHLLHPLFNEAIDPSDYHITKETTAAGDFIYEALKNGDSHEKVDLAFIAEGYLAEDKDKFKSDVDRFASYLFTIEPYKSNKTKFNIYGILRPSPERAMDEPRQGVFRKTVLNASFNAFDLDRYMLIEQDHRLHEIAAQVPYDVIVVLVNSKRYGGGSICLDYCVSTVDHASSRQVFVHELGHSFAGLADEYYTSEVAYNDFYPKGVEPAEPNITALLDRENVKWKDLLSPGISVPTEYGKEKIESLQAERRKNREAQTKATELAKQKGQPEAQVKKIQEKFREADKTILKQIEDVRKQYASLNDKVGVFEGAGYASKGLYRPMIYCLMISNPKDEFCLVCQRAISRMIDYYAD